MRVWLGLAVLVLAVRPVAAQSLLPDHFANWQAVPASAAAATPAMETSPSDAAIYRACQQQSVERQSYQRNGATLTVTLRRMGDPSYAYSAYSLLRPESASRFRPTPHASIGNNEAMMLVGNLLVDVSGQNLAADAHDFSALAAALKPHASDEAFPTLWQYLPTEHVVPYSDHYVMGSETLSQALGSGDWGTGDWLGFNDEAEAEIARYDFAGQRMTLILASYPTPQLAIKQIDNLKQWFDVDPKAGAAGGKPVLYTRRVGSLVGLVSGAPGKASADRLLKQIRYQTIVTWNEPGFKLTDLTMADYVVGIIFGTFAIIGIALIVGIALGMVRVGVKHFLPGVVFDRHRSIEILQLGLTSKPINARDFY